MTFTKKANKEGSLNGKVFSVFMLRERKNRYVCDFIDDNTEEAAAVNELGLTLRARLNRSNGDFAMLKGSIFNPNKLLTAAMDIADYTIEQVAGGIEDAGHALLTVTADGCVNKYIIFNPITMTSLEKNLKARAKK